MFFAVKLGLVFGRLNPEVFAEHLSGFRQKFRHFCDLGGESEHGSQIRFYTREETWNTCNARETLNESPYRLNAMARKNGSICPRASETKSTKTELKSMR